MTDRVLFTDYLAALGVPHTAAYSRRRFMTYPHKMALTAVGDLLAEYGVMPGQCGACDSPDPASLHVPAVVALRDGSFAIVKERDAAGRITLRTRGEVASVPADDFAARWTGAAVWGDVAEGSSPAEPHLARHRFVQTMHTAQQVALALGLAFLLAYCYVAHGLWHSWAQTALIAAYGAGIYVTYLLVLKDNGVHSAQAERMCGVIQKGGCGRVLDSSSSRLFGLYPWCEIGLTYFSVSLAALLVCPGCTPWLAAFAVCCLPYTVWSVAWQRFKIHAWCTLCLTVQALMWIIFALMLLGGQFGSLWPVPARAVALAVCYVTAFLLLHHMVPRLNLYERPSD